MLLLRARHEPTDTDVTIVAILIKANDDIIAVYIDPDGELDEDDYKNFNSFHDVYHPE